MKNEALARNPRFLKRHSLGIVAVSILGSWVVLYSITAANSHWGSFLGNAIADWTGVSMMVLATKWLYEAGSDESNPPPNSDLSRIKRILQRHSLTIFLLITGAGWILLFIHMNPVSRWGTVVSNLVSEWSQLLGLVLFTKKLRETKSEESK